MENEIKKKCKHDWYFVNSVKGKFYGWMIAIFICPLCEEIKRIEYDN